MTSTHITRFIRWFAGAGLLLMTAVIAWQVFARYVLNASPAWAESLAQLLMIWYVLFAAAAGVREGFHIRISVVANSASRKRQRIMNIAAHTAVGLFGLGMGWWGTELILATWEHEIPALNLPRGMAYVPIPLSGLLIAWFSLEHVRAELSDEPLEPTWS